MQNIEAGDRARQHSLDSSNEPFSLLPAYYRERDLEVEYLFIITDLRELVANNFKTFFSRKNPR
ncbi:hypothetical protein [uncultured Helicobacter sp.]|uniref:hypothetical protein n=1 Tax=uncultured Helicobacter sp. TaxID=175537 RepID=UPI001C3AEEB5|nr:hypothetical protein [Candidatus Helicobacter avicola]